MLGSRDPSDVNPTSRTEAQPRDILNGLEVERFDCREARFPPVNRGGRTHVIGRRTTHSLPGNRLGAVVTDASEVTDEMFLVAAEALAALVPEASSRKVRSIRNRRILGRLSGDRGRGRRAARDGGSADDSAYTSSNRRSTR